MEVLGGLMRLRGGEISPGAEFPRVRQCKLLIGIQGVLWAAPRLVWTHRGAGLMSSAPRGQGESTQADSVFNYYLEMVHRLPEPVIRLVECQKPVCRITRGKEMYGCKGWRFKSRTFLVIIRDKEKIEQVLKAADGLYCITISVCCGGAEEQEVA